MIANILYMLIISSGGVFGAAFLKRRFEELVPLTQMAIILLLFIFGLVEKLYLGCLAVIVFASMLYLFSFWYVAKYRTWKAFAKKCLSAGGGLFLLTYTALTIYNYGRLCINVGEFSHWMDIVKVMTVLDNFGTDQQAFSYFASYPPGISLLQYLIQKLNQICCPGAEILEWTAFQCIQIFAISMFLPFYKKITFRNGIGLLLLCAITLLFPLSFFGDFYDNLQVDALLAVMSGTGLALISREDKKDWLYRGHICLLCATLTLIKDVGFVLALFLCIVYGGEILITRERGRGGLSDFSSICKILWKSLLPFLLTGAVRILWDMEIRLSGVDAVFAEKIRLQELLQAIGDEQSYEFSIMLEFLNALVLRPLNFTVLGIRVDSLMFLYIYCAASYILWKTSRLQGGSGKTLCLACWLQIVQCIVFVLGTCIVYMYRFHWYEAYALTSFERFIGTPFLAGGIFLLLVAQDLLQSSMVKSGIHQAALLLVLLLSMPMDVVTNGFRLNRSEEWDKRKDCAAFGQQIRNQCEDGAAVWVVDQMDDGYNFWMLRYLIRPVSVPQNCAPTLGPMTEESKVGGMYTQNLTAHQWQGRLSGEYDYVVLYQLNDYFIETFSELFEDPNSISERCIYRVDKITGMLTLCE